jgi:hypothetical protein
MFICINKKAHFQLSETTEHTDFKENKGKVVACDTMVKVHYGCVFLYNDE